MVYSRAFHPYAVNNDPKAISAATFAYNTALGKAFKSRQWHPTPTVIIPTTPVASNLPQAMKYPNIQESAKAHDIELDNIDEMKTIHCISPDFVTPSKPLPITMAHSYKWTTGFQLVQRKARGTFRSDLMVPFVHIDPVQLAATMAFSSMVCMLFFLKARFNVHMEPIDITSAFLHEAFGFSQTVYVPNIRRSDRSYGRSNTVGILNGKMYGCWRAGNYFMLGVIKCLKSEGYAPTDFDPCLYYEQDNANFILFSISIDYILVISTLTARVDSLFACLHCQL